MDKAGENLGPKSSIEESDKGDTIGDKDAESDISTEQLGDTKTPGTTLCRWKTFEE